MNIEDDKSQEVEEIINGIKDIVAKERERLESLQNKTKELEKVILSLET